METTNETTSSPRRAWYETGFPAVYLVIGVLFMATSIHGLLAEGRSVRSVVVSFLGGVVMLVMASVTIVLRLRHGHPANEQGPLAQESDPSRRQG